MKAETEMRRNLNNYLSKISDERLTTFNCTSCNAEIGTLKPEAGAEAFDTLCICPDCDHSMFKVVYDTGRVRVESTPSS